MTLMYIAYSRYCFAQFLRNAKCLSCRILYVVEFYIRLHSLYVCTERVSMAPNETAKIMHLLLAFGELFLIGFFLNS